MSMTIITPINKPFILDSKPIDGLWLCCEHITPNYKPQTYTIIMPYLEINTQQLPTTQEYIAATNKPALESQIAKTTNQNDKFANFRKYDFLSSNSESKQAPSINNMETNQKTNGDLEAVKTKNSFENPKLEVKKQSKFSKFMSFFRKSKVNDLKNIEDKNYKTPDLPKIKSIKVFNNGIDGDIINGSSEEKSKTLSNFTETLNKDLGKTGINFEFVLEGNKYIIIYKSRSNQTTNNLDSSLCDQPIVIDNHTTSVIRKLAGQIEAGI